MEGIGLKPAEIGREGGIKRVQDYQKDRSEYILRNYQASSRSPSPVMSDCTPSFAIYCRAVLVVNI